jgi:ABC-2 type transport system ATP-binding protein
MFGFRKADIQALFSRSRVKAVQASPLSERAVPLLAVTGLRRSFGAVEVLSGVDAEVRSGEAVAVVGPNGSGKTTLLRCVAGLDRPSAGSIHLRGRPIRERNPQTRQSVAAVLDDVEFFADLAVAEHLALLISAHGGAAPDEHAASLLDEVGLADAADQLPAGLSSGQRRRLALATCFARPRLLVLLDEPEQRLDSGGRRWLKGRLLAEKQEGRGVLFASHDRSLVKAVADRVLDLVATS